MAVSPQQIMGSGTAGPGFVFGGSTGVTPEQLRKRRAVLEAMMARVNSHTPQNLGEGIASLGETIGNVSCGNGRSTATRRRCRRSRPASGTTSAARSRPAADRLSLTIPPARPPRPVTFPRQR